MKNRLFRIFIFVMALAFVFIVLWTSAFYTAGAQGTEDRVYLPLVFRSLTTPDTRWGDTPTPAPTMCPGFWDNGVCDPTPTPYVICFGPGTEPCPTPIPTVE